MFALRRAAVLRNIRPLQPPASSTCREQTAGLREYEHRDALESNRAESLQEIVEHIEWRGTVYSETPGKVARLLADPKEDLTLLSDRQLSVLLSTFGNACESVSILHRTASMSQALRAIRERGKLFAYTLQSEMHRFPLACDNGEQALSPDAATFGYLSKVYANSANTQAIVDIINHMKTNALVVTEAVLESLIYSLAKGGHYKQAETFVQKFVASANEVVLRTAIARAAVSRGDYSVVFSTIASIPSGAKPNQISNNKYILEVLFDMLEAGEMDAVEKISPYLAMAPEENTLVEWHVNPRVLARSKRACAEGKLDVALKLYGLIHPKFKNSNFEMLLADALGNRLNDGSHKTEEIFGLAEAMQNSGLLKDHVLFLLEKSANTTRAYEVLSIVQSRGLLEKCLQERPALRKTLARKLSEKVN
ncbi:hypothetical protein COOONC_26422 [Cooperia oncophora]